MQRALLKEFATFRFYIYKKFELVQKCAQYLMSKFVSAMLKTVRNTFRNNREILYI